MEHTTLTQEELNDALDLALWAGQLLLRYGAETEKVEDTVRTIGMGLGCERMSTYITYNSILASVSSDVHDKTKLIKAVRQAVNYSIISDVYTLTMRVANRELDRAQVRRQLMHIDTTGPIYNRWLVVGMTGLACASFSQIFGGDYFVFFITWLAASCAMFVRQQLHRRFFNPLVTVVISAFTATMIASIALLYEVDYNLTYASAVLLLIPGVPLINSAEDLLKGHILTGTLRGILGFLISLSIAFGILMALYIVGLPEIF